MNMDRYSVTGAMYNMFDHRIMVPSLAHSALYYHEYYHHIQNVSTVLGGERLNLLVQFLAHTSHIARTEAPIYLPLNAWYEQGKATGFRSDNLQQRLENVVYHQDLWLYLDKMLHTIRLITSEQREDEYLALVEQPAMDSVEPYIIREQDGLAWGYPVGGFVIMESGAYALELWHQKIDDPSLLRAIDKNNYQYLLILELAFKLLGNFRLACLATFLWCDLAMIIATPAIGFFALYRLAKVFFTTEATEETIHKWYTYAYESFRDEIANSMASEQAIIDDIRARKAGFHELLDGMLEFQLGLMEKGLRLRLENRMLFPDKLLSGKVEDLAELQSIFPPSVVETTEDGNLHFDDEKTFDFFELLNACYTLLFGLCRRPRLFYDQPDLRHFQAIDNRRFRFHLEAENNQSDGLGYMLHTMGLLDQEIIILPNHY